MSAQLSRPQIGIDRLPVRRLSNEPKEAMNCKSCRKRKIKCNRLRPSCEACQVFNCACIYDAIPKKRGPKTDVLEALLKRVNGLEKRLKDEGKSLTPEDKESTEVVVVASEDVCEADEKAPVTVARQLSDPSPTALPHQNKHQQPPSQIAHQTPKQAQPTVGFPDAFPARQQAPAPQNNALLDIYFSSHHNKPFYILDEAATRQRWQSGQLPTTIVNAINSVAARHAPHLLGGHNAAVRMSEECAMRARQSLDSDEPTIENVQVSLLLSDAFFQAGKGKKSYMLLSSAISMAFALGLHRELPTTLRISPNEREGRRKLFWSCYIMDRFVAAGSKRPSLIGDEAIGLRLPAWNIDSSSMPFEGNFFSNGTNVPLSAGPGRMNQSSGSMLIEIVRVLGITNRYLAAGGVKGDSHFPWHAQSNLSRIRQDLDTWAASAQDAFLSIETLFAQPECSTLVLSKLIYHLIHCLIYRPFLPVDLAELSGTGQHQSWQIEATNLCFLHANAIAELLELGKASSMTDWPAFVGYCLCTAGTIHVHGAHYLGRDGDVFARSADFLSREMAQLSDLRIIWVGVQHQRETLQTVYGCHSQLVKSLASNPMRFSPVFQMEDFFDRYPGQFIDGAYVTFSEITVDALHESLPAYHGLNNSTWQWGNIPMNSATMPPPPPSTQPQQTTSDSNQTKTTDRKRRRTHDASSRSPPVAQAIHDPALNPTTSPRTDFATSSQPTMSSQPGAASENKNNNNNNNNNDAQTFTQNPLSPTFSFSPWATNLPLSHAAGLDSGQTGGFDTMFSLPQSFDQPTPGGMSANGSAHTEGDKDPFLSLLEQLAENEQSRGGPSDLDFYLSGQG
ncbi:hypothetical protein MBLNU459_g6224t1 [Dothideomycetes sp. NU459]